MSIAAFGKDLSQIAKRVHSIKGRKHIFFFPVGLRAMKDARFCIVRQQPVYQRYVSETIGGARAKPPTRLEYAVETPRNGSRITKMLKGEIRENEIDRIVRQRNFGSCNDDGAVECGIGFYRIVDIDSDGLPNLAFNLQ